MPSITLTDPVTGTTVASGLIATNNSNLRNLLNAGLDSANLKGNPALVSGDVPVWDGTNFVKPTGTPDATKFLRGDKSWAVVNTGPLVTTSLYSAGPPGSPTTGDIWHATAVDTGNLATTNGTVWTFKYNGSSGSASKWEFVGGAPLYNSSAGGVNASSATYVASGAVLTMARAGDYEAIMYLPATGNTGSTNGNAGLSVNSANPGSPIFMQIQSAGLIWDISDAQILTGVTASQTIGIRHNCAAGGTSITSGVNRLMVRPVRIA